MEVGVWGLEFWVWGVGFEVWGLEFGVWGLKFEVWDFGFGSFGALGLNFRVEVLTQGCASERKEGQLERCSRLSPRPEPGRDCLIRAEFA